MIYVDHANGYEVDFRGYDGEIEYAAFYRTGSRNYSLNRLQRGASVFQTHSSSPYHFFLDTWPTTARSRIRSGSYLFWADYFLIPMVLYASLFPLLALIYYRKIWLFLINVPFYGIYAILVALSKVLYM